MSLALNQSSMVPALAQLRENYPKIRKLQTVEQVDDMMNYMVSILNIKVSNDIEKKQLDQQMILVLDLIKSKFGDLTVPEVKEAFKMYVARDFDIKVFRLLDCIAIGEVLTAYINHRDESLRVYNDKKEKEKYKEPEISAEEQHAKIVKAVNRVYNEYRATGNLEEFAEMYIFDFLVEQKKIIINGNPKVQDYFNDKLKEAQKKLRIIQSKKSSFDPKERHDIKRELKSITQGTSPAIIIMAKKIILTEYFDKQIFNNIENIFLCEQ